MKNKRDSTASVLCCFKEQKKKMALRIKHAQKSWKLPSLFVLLLVFLGTCAVVFNHLESERDRELYKIFRKRKIFWMRKYNMSEEEFSEFIEEATIINKKGYSGAYKNYWGFYHSFWFTITVITTMGFGQVVPVTFWGRLFCIICALLGIPLNALVLKLVGEKISKLISDAIRKLEKRLMKRATPRRIGVKCAVVSFSLMVMVICIGGALDTIFDGWTFFDGVYFNFIALSTIGFGDLFPRTDQSAKLDGLGFGDSGKRIFASVVMLVFMIIGLSITSTVIYSIIKAIEEASQIQVQWSRRGRLADVLSLRKLNRKNNSRNTGNTPEIIISTASDDKGEINDAAELDTVCVFDNEGESDEGMHMRSTAAACRTTGAASSTNKPSTSRASDEGNSVDNDPRHKLRHAPTSGTAQGNR